MRCVDGNPSLLRNRLTSAVERELFEEGCSQAYGPVQRYHRTDQLAQYYTEREFVLCRGSNLAIPSLPNTVNGRITRGSPTALRFFDESSGGLLSGYFCRKRNSTSCTGLAESIASSVTSLKAEYTCPNRDWSRHTSQ